MGQVVWLVRVGKEERLRSGEEVGEIHGLKGYAVFLIAIITASIVSCHFLLLLACTLTVFKASLLEQSLYN